MFENVNTIEFITIAVICLAFLFYVKYQNIKITMDNYYKYVKPDADKREIKNFIDKLSKLDDYNNIADKYNELVKQHNDMIDIFDGTILEFVNRFEEIFDVFHYLNAEMWNECYDKNEKVKEVFDKHEDKLHQAYEGFDSIIDDLNRLLEVWEENRRERK